jgi:hypothetical protein
VTTRILIASDLDRTLIYSRAALGFADDRPEPPLVAVEELDGRPISFMTLAAFDQLSALAADHLFVPVTTRTQAQLHRVQLGGLALPYQVAANGGVLLVDGVVDRDWSMAVTRAVGGVAPLTEAVATMAAACAGEWAGPPKIAESLFCYVVVDRTAMQAATLDDLREWARTAGWTVSLQGRKLYLVPRPLTKSAAVAEIARRAGSQLTLAAGDSLLDIDLLLGADRGVHPGHGEIAGSGWSALHVEALDSVGGRAGEDVVAWLAARASEHGDRHQLTSEGAVRVGAPTAGSAEEEL